MQTIKKKLKQRLTRPNEAVIPPPLTFEEAELAWQMQIQSQFKKAGMDKYLESTKVEGGWMRPAVRDEGGLCDYPGCPKEYEYALELDNFKSVILESNIQELASKGISPFDNWEDFTKEFHESARPAKLLESGSMEKGLPMTVYVCSDHKDYRPTELHGHRFAEHYVWNRSGIQGRGVSKIPSIQRIEEAKS